MLTKLMAKLGYTKAAKSEAKPPIDMDKLVRELAGRINADAGPTHIKMHRYNTDTGEFEATDAVEVHKPVPKLYRGSNSLELPGWGEYLRAMQATAVPGWSFGFMLMKDSSEDDRALTFVGNMRADYGVFTTPMHCCSTEGITEEAAEKFCGPQSPILAQLVHLPTGFGFGVFEDRATACHAAELLDGIFPAFQPVPPEKWEEMVERVYGLWRFNGIDKVAGCHSHPLGHPGAIPILAKIISLEANRPEKLS